MTESTKEQIAFRVDTGRVLQIISSEIYDSPMALLRENVQNAYDAILMRVALQSGFGVTDGMIDVKVTDNELSIADNGIGMDRSTITENFWKAGSSGKRTEFARKAGVVGTFGIGAMANFGVCTRLSVVTRSVSSERGITTIAERDKLSLNEDCIDLIPDVEREVGTTVTAVLDSEHAITEQVSKDYLTPYVKYVPIAVRINGHLVSQQNYQSIVAGEPMGDGHAIAVDDGDLSFKVSVVATAAAQFGAKVTQIRINNADVLGDAAFTQHGGAVFGLRNSFGLAPAPISSHYQLGGVANIATLHPTAGREALARESIEFLNRIIRLVERAISEAVAITDLSDKSTAFMSWIVAHGRYDLAGKIGIAVAGERENMTLAAASILSKTGKTAYFAGQDRNLVASYEGAETKLLLLAQTNPRRQVQTHWLHQHEIREVPNTVTVLETYGPAQLGMGEVGLAIRIAATMADDYLVPNARVEFVKLSHEVPLKVTATAEHVEILLHRESGELRALVQCYHDALDVFGGFVRDFVRVRLYPLFASVVPSATREGADALRKALQRKREVYRYDADDLGGIEGLISDYITGKSTFSSVIASIGLQNPHVQRLTKESVGRAEEEIGGIAQAPATSRNDTAFGPAPPILRRESETTSKVLTVGGAYEVLNGVKLFLGLADRVARQELDFFLQPHTTKVIWGSHRVIFIFTDALASLTFYYDIETKEALRDTVAGGIGLPTTTIITSNRIYVPIPDELVPSFTLQAGAKELYVRYDYISN
jgi:molecular chaperone HtpG